MSYRITSPWVSADMLMYQVDTENASYIVVLEDDGRVGGVYPRPVVSSQPFEVSSGDYMRVVAILAKEGILDGASKRRVGTSVSRQTSEEPPSVHT